MEKGLGWRGKYDESKSWANGHIREEGFHLKLTKMLSFDYLFENFNMENRVTYKARQKVSKVFRHKWVSNGQ